MKKIISLLALFILFTIHTFAKESLKSILDNYNNTTYQTGKPIPQIESITKSNPLQTGIIKAIEKLNQFENFKKNIDNKSAMIMAGDTLFVTDSIFITGDFVSYGPIVVVGDGYISFKKANAVFYGDVILYGNNAKIVIDSSNIVSPQDYFYQRSWISVLKGQFLISNSVLDFSGLSHSLSLINSSSYILKNVVIKGFTTAGVSGTSKVDMDKVDVAGEYILTEQTAFNFKNTNNILLWHQLPSGSISQFEFPSGDIVSAYLFNSKSPGIVNLNYSISLTNCKNVMWALMPVSGSICSVKNSDLRAIGLWFNGNDSLNTSNIINNTKFKNDTLMLPDRLLTLSNTLVQTWNIYTFDKFQLQLFNSTIGEFGSQGQSKATLANVTCDGTGGYIGAKDTTQVFYGYSNSSATVRSEKYGLLVFGFSTLTNGQAVAKDNSVIIVTQSKLPTDPIPLDNSCAWFANIENLSSGFNNSNIPILGSAWIHKTPTSQLMGFGFYQLFYRKKGATNWLTMSDIMKTEVSHNLLYNWDTKGLDSGDYEIKLSLTDDTNDFNTIDAIVQVKLIQNNTDVEEVKTNFITLYRYSPNEKVIKINKDYRAPISKIKMYDILGNLIYQDNGFNDEIKTNSFLNGPYFINSEIKGRIIPCKILIY